MAYIDFLLDPLEFNFVYFLRSEYQDAYLNFTGKMLSQPYHLMDFLEVIVQALAVLLLFIAVRLSARAVRVSEAAAKAAMDEVKMSNLEILEDRKSFKQSFQNTRYDALDRFYFDLLRETMVDPELLETARTWKSGAPRSGPTGKYSSFALCIWNFLESIKDKCKDDPELKDTWWPIIDAEARRHRLWLREQDAAGKYVHAQFFSAESFAYFLSISEDKAAGSGNA